MKLAKNVWDHVSTCVRGVRGVTRWSTLKNCHIDWVGSILVNGILNLRLSGCSSITSSKYRNVEFNFVSCSNLRRSLGIMYHMLIHGPTSFWPFWCPIGSFIRGFSHPTSHSGLRESEYSSNKSKVTLHEFTFNFCFIAAILIFLPVNHNFVRVLSGTIYGQTKKYEYSSNKTKVEGKLMHSNICFIAAILIFFVCL